MMLRKILLRFFALLLVVFFLNLTYKEYFWAGDRKSVV